MTLTSKSLTFHKGPTQSPPLLTSTHNHEQNPAMGDTNQHHNDWSLIRVTPTLKTQQFINWLMDGGFMLMYEKGVPTYFEHNSQGASSTINLTFVNPVVHALDAAQEWTVDAKSSCGSDHHAL
ncbi:hypothetical protein F5879DRAFT_996306 [Lentinula edodes]|nr:hypothetical protein F5879DRAFT_996306 [Lentinula edodes]